VSVCFGTALAAPVKDRSGWIPVRPLLGADGQNQTFTLKGHSAQGGTAAFGAGEGEKQTFVSTDEEDADEVLGGDRKGARWPETDKYWRCGQPQRDGAFRAHGLAPPRQGVPKFQW
jgi:hypothetical protein